MDLTISRFTSQSLRPLFSRTSRTQRLVHTTSIASSGHNRWSKIRHRKGAADSAKSSQFSKITNEIYLSLRPPASPNPALNPRLSAILTKAKEVGYPKANVESAMNKALNPVEGTLLQSITYEAVGPGGQVGLIIECLTDNGNRCVSRVKEQLNKYGGRMSPTSFLFERKGLIKLSLADPALDRNRAFDQLFEVAVEAGAEDVRMVPMEDGDQEEVIGFEVVTPPTEVSTVASIITNPFTVTGIEVAYLPITPLRLPAEEGEAALQDQDSMGEVMSEELADKVFGLVEGLEETGDVVKVWTNVAGVQ